MLRDLDDRKRAVEKDKRSPGGQGYTGFEAFLSYVFDQMMAINIFDENGYILKVNLSASECSEYQNADSIKRKEKESPGFISRCLAGLGPNQPGVTTADPTDTGVDDPGHEPHAARPRRARRSQEEVASRTRTARRARTRPASPTSRRRSRSCSSGGGGNTPERADALAAERARSRTSRCPTSRAPNVPGVTGGSGGQSVDPKALLDYLLSP